VSQDVIPIRSGASDGRSVVETSMRAVEIVVAKPEREIGVAVVGTGIVAGPDPLAEYGLDEAFSLAVGAWRIRSSEALLDAVQAQVLAKALGAVTRSVVGEDRAQRNAESMIERTRLPEEVERGASGLVGIDAGVSDAGVVVDADMQVLSTPDATAQPAAAVVVMVEDREFLDVEVDEVARRGVLISHQRRSRFEIAQAAELQPAQDARDGGTAEMQGLRDVHAGPALPAQDLHELGDEFVSLSRRAVRTGRPVEQAGATLPQITANPFASGMGIDLELGRGRVQGPVSGEDEKN